MECVICRRQPTQKAHLDPQVMQLGIRNLLMVNTMDPDRSFLVRTFCYLSHTSSRTVSLPAQHISSQSILDTDRVQVAVERCVELELESRGLSDTPEAEQQVRKAVVGRAVSILRNMRSSISALVLRISTWALFHILGRMLRSVQIHKGQVEALRRASRASPGTPLIFLPLHKSHMDYILISFVCTNHDIPPPLVAAGDNLRIPVFGWLLSHLGAFYIKRRLDGDAGTKDTLYRAVLQAYMTEALAQGHNMEFFIEGGRSRNGKPKVPKAGLLSVVVQAYEEQRIEDVLVVPVGISYERIMDGNFISEQLGRAKQAETFLAALGAIWTALRTNYGSVRLDFAQPFKLSEFISRPAGGLTSSCPAVRGSSSSLYGIEVVQSRYRNAVQALAEHVTFDAAGCCAVMCTQLTALLLLHRFRQGCTLTALTNAFTKARDDLRTRGVDVGFRGDSRDVVEYALALLGPGLVTQERLEVGAVSAAAPAGSPARSQLQVTFVRPVTILPNVLELAYYANMALHPLSADAVLVTALLSLLSVDLAAAVDAGPCPELQVGRSQLLTCAADLADLLRDELLVGPPCQTVDDRLQEPLNRLTSAEILTTPEHQPADESEAWAGRAFQRFKDMERTASDDDDEDDDFHPRSDLVWTVHLTADTLEHVLYLQSTAAPLVDTYYTTACCLHRLVAQEVAEADFVLDVLYEIKNKLMLGLLTYGESLSAECVRGAVRTFERWGVVESYRQDSLRLLYLSADYDGEQQLAELISRIHAFKK